MRLGLTSFVILFAWPLHGQSVSPHARKAEQTIDQLRAIGLPRPDDLASGPPGKVPGLLRQLNHEIRGLIIDTLNDPSRRKDPSGIDVIAQLRAAGWDDVPDHKFNAYGEVVQINLEEPLGYDPRILIATTQLWLPCGSADPDSAIYVFRRNGQTWELLIAVDADFDLVGNSLESGMQFKISPQNSIGDWFLAIANSPPACRPGTPYLHYRILRPGVNPDKPLIILNRREPLDAGFEPPFRLQTEEDWFAVTRGKRRKLDDEPGISISRYKIDAESVTRMQPIALTPEDFFDEWMQLSWGEASKWADESPQAGLAGWHLTLSKLTDDSTDIEFVQPCSEEGGTENAWLIGLWIDRQQNPASEHERLFVSLSKRHGAFYLDSIHESRPSECAGSTPVRILDDRNLPSW